MSKEKKSNPLKQQALENIKRKKEIIDDWIENGIPNVYDDNNNPVRDNDGEKLLDFFPTSLRLFFTWNGTQNCNATRKSIGPISGTGTTTLDNYPELKWELEQSLKTIKSKAVVQNSRQNKTAAYNALQEELDLAILQRETSEKKYIGMLKKHESIENDLRKERLAHEQSIKHLSRVLEQKDTEINTLQAQLSELRKTVDKIVKLETVR